jgi:hypothetical protein
VNVRYRSLSGGIVVTFLELSEPSAQRRATKSPAYNLEAFTTSALTMIRREERDPLSETSADLITKDFEELVVAEVIRDAEEVQIA